MHPNIIRYKEEFTLDEVAWLMAGVGNDAPDNHRDVVSALRDLLKGVEKFQLYPAVPMSLEDVPLHTASGDYNWDSPWRYIPVRVELLEKWFVKEKRPIPWKTTPEAGKEEFAQAGQLVPSSLASEAGYSALPRQKERAGHSQESLMRIIAALVVMLIEVDKGKSLIFGEKLNKPNKSTLFKKIDSALKHMDAPTTGVNYAQFADILTDEFYDDIVNALNK